MRQQVIAGNWKMNFSLEEGIRFLSELNSTLPESLPNHSVMVFPPFITLNEATKATQDTHIVIGAQNCHYEDQGAFTGEISTEMITSTGASSVLVGHSERREYYNETNKDCNKKIKKAIKSGLTVIYCVGETLEERESGRTEDVIKMQLEEGLAGCNTELASGNLIIAYEPVWAIGTGKVAEPEQANGVHVFIRHIIKTISSTQIANALPILYGGSVKPTNAKELLSQSDIDGALIGGAALDIASFTSIIETSLSI